MVGPALPRLGGSTAASPATACRRSASLSRCDLRRQFGNVIGNRLFGPERRSASVTAASSTAATNRGSARSARPRRPSAGFGGSLNRNVRCDHPLGDCLSRSLGLSDGFRGCGIFDRLGCAFGEPRLSLDGHTRTSTPCLHELPSSAQTRLVEGGRSVTGARETPKWFDRLSSCSRPVSYRSLRRP